MERSSRQRDAVVHVLHQAARPLTPSELLRQAQTIVPGLGLATVYRHLKALSQTGDIMPVHLPGQMPRYERAGRDHHHHFQCTVCEQVFEVDQCPGDLEHLAPTGFEVTGHDLTLFGRCTACQKPARPLPTPGPS